MIRFLISAAFEVWRLLEGGAYSDQSVNSATLLEGGAYLRPATYLMKDGNF